MATVNTITFNAGSGGTDGSYTAGDSIVATVDYTPDAGSGGTPQTFDLTANVLDSNGNVVASNTAPFTVTIAGAGQTVAASDTGGHVWSEGSTTTEPDGSLSVPFTSTA